jgi:hypothetical protein
MTPSTFLLILFVLLFIMFATQTYSLKLWFFKGGLRNNKPSAAKLRANPDFGKKLLPNPLNAR